MTYEKKAPSLTIKKYHGILLSIISIINVLIFLGFSYQAHQLIKEQILEEARAFFLEITITRQWVSKHQGVYVKMTPGITVNPYLAKIPGLKTVIHDEDGQAYTLKNPAIVTREISDLAMETRVHSFHMTSLKPINPANKADEFEQEALQGFAKNENSEIYRFIEDDSGRYFRYMAPLITQESCLECHGFQGYKTGDIRGGISVTIPSEKTHLQLKKNIIYMILSSLGIIALIFSVIKFISYRFTQELNAAQHQLVNQATTDFLTGLLNRREGLRRFRAELALSKRKNTPVSTIVVDIDHFKSINDTMGHLAGDRVLEHLALSMQKELREYDVICRYGGEEFLFVLPDTHLDQAVEIAERIRTQVEQSTITLLGREVKVTISLGVAQFSPAESIDTLISRADNALYRAKDQGRNQVEIAT